MGVKRVEQGSKHAALRCSCVDGQWGGVGIDLHWLSSAEEEVKDPVTKGDIEAKVLELGDEGMIVLNTDLVNEQQPDIRVSVIQMFQSKVVFATAFPLCSPWSLFVFYIDFLFDCNIDVTMADGRVACFQSWQRVWCFPDSEGIFLYQDTINDVGNAQICELVHVLPAWHESRRLPWGYWNEEKDPCLSKIVIRWKSWDASDKSINNDLKIAGSMDHLNSHLQRGFSISVLASFPKVKEVAIEPEMDLYP